MANNNLYLVHVETGERIRIAKYYPSSGWYCTMSHGEINAFFDLFAGSDQHRNGVSYRLEYEHGPHDFEPTPPATPMGWTTEPKVPGRYLCWLPDESHPHIDIISEDEIQFVGGGARWCGPLPDLKDGCILRSILAGMTDDDRLEVFRDYCLNCGRYQGDSDGSCECDNDE